MIGELKEGEVALMYGIEKWGQEWKMTFLPRIPLKERLIKKFGENDRERGE